MYSILGYRKKVLAQKYFIKNLLKAEGVNEMYYFLFLDKKQKTKKKYTHSELVTFFCRLVFLLKIT